MRARAHTVMVDRQPEASAWGLAAVVFVCFVLGFSAPRLLGGRAKPQQSAPEATVAVASAAPRAAITPAAPAASLPTTRLQAAPASEAPVTPPPAAAATPAAAAPSASTMKTDEATTVYERTLVRQSAPDGDIIARIPMGTVVRIVDHKANWYHVKYGQNREGWIYKKSIGK